MEQKLKFEKVSYTQFCADAQKNGIFLTPAEMVEAYEGIELPKRATEGSAGYDFRSPLDLIIKPGSTSTFPTGIKAEMPKWITLLMFIRSSLGIKRGLSLPNGVAVIDSDFYGNESNDGDITMVLRNGSDVEQHIIRGQAVAQGVFVEYGKTDEDMAIGIRKGGIGSTT